MASTVLVIAGGIYMAAHLPARPPLGLAEVLTGLGGLVMKSVRWAWEDGPKVPGARVKVRCNMGPGGNGHEC